MGHQPSSGRTTWIGLVYFFGIGLSSQRDNCLLILSEYLSGSVYKKNVEHFSANRCSCAYPCPDEAQLPAWNNNRRVPNTKYWHAPQILCSHRPRIGVSLKTQNFKHSGRLYQQMIYSPCWKGNLWRWLPDSNQHCWRSEGSFSVLHAHNPVLISRHELVPPSKNLDLTDIRPTKRQSTTGVFPFTIYDNGVRIDSSNGATWHMSNVSSKRDRLTGVNSRPQECAIEFFRKRNHQMN